MNALIEMTTLYFSRPAPDANDEVVATWYRAKAELHARLAASGVPDAEQEQVYAAASYARACSLTAA